MLFSEVLGFLFSSFLRIALLQVCLIKWTLMVVPIISFSTGLTLPYTSIWEGTMNNREKNMDLILI